MIQELFGGGNHTSAGGELITNVGEKDSSPHFTGVVHAPAISQPKSSTTTTTTNPKTSSENLTPLRCPRCDSSNTKFCYYNNYNLTQPRHFCKTCRRYWTKGGALRNVPIGGGCRKNNKINNNIGHAILPSPLGKPKFIRSHLLTSSDSMGKILSSNFPNQFDQGLSANNSLLWTSPQTSHLLALLRSNQTQNPNFNYAMMMNYVKQEECSEGLRILDPSSYNSNNFWRNNNHEESHQADELHQQSGTGLMVQNVSNQDYNQRVGLKSADHEHYNNYSDTHNYVPGLIMGNVHASSSPANCSEILESAPVTIVGGGSQLVSCWNNNNNNNI